VKVNTRIAFSDTNSYQNEISTTIRACRAAYAGDVKVLSTLKANGVNLDAADYDERTPLEYAVRANRTEAVKFLLSSGVEVNPIDRWKYTPLYYAIWNNHTEIESILREAGGVLGEDEFTMYFNDRKFNITNNDVRLFYAAYYGDLKTAEYLYDTGAANIKATDIDGRSAVHIAASMN
jgi:ankyrin repeat protein